MVDCRTLVRILVDADMRRVGLEPPDEGLSRLSDLFPDRWWARD
jgi:hypothetical protein